MNDREAELVKVAGDLFVKAGAGRHRKPQLTAETGMDLAKKFGPKIYAERVAHRAVCREQCAEERSDRLRLGLDRVEYLLME